MFSLQIVDTDAFLEMPVSSQLLYFHFAMRADDEGFIGNPKKIMRLVGVQEDDYKILVAKRFLLTFESGVVVIKHWLIHNTIRMDRFNQTTYQEEKNRITTKKNRSYTELATNWQPNDNQLATQVKLSKVNLSKVNLIESGDESPTPAQIAKDFFTNSEKQDEVIKDLITKGIPEVLAEKEINKFCSYWTEKNKSGTKQRWEMEKTFEINRRLATWFGNIKNFSGSQNNQQREILSTT